MGGDNKGFFSFLNTSNYGKDRWKVYGKSCGVRRATAPQSCPFLQNAELLRALEDQAKLLRALEDLLRIMLHSSMLMRINILICSDKTDLSVVARFDPKNTLIIPVKHGGGSITIHFCSLGTILRHHMTRYRREHGLCREKTSL